MIEGAGVELIRLESPEYPELTLLEDDIGPFNVTRLDLGYPEPREVIRRSPFVDGEDDTTELHGSRVATLELDVFGSADYGVNHWVRELSNFTSPWLRPKLVIHPQGFTDPIYAHARCQSFEADWVSSSPGRRSVMSLWKIPRGRFQSTIEKIRIAQPFINEGGRTYPEIYPKVFENLGPLSGVGVNNLGNARACTTLRIFGPITGPEIINDTLSEREGRTIGYLFKPAFQILEGDYVEIVCEERKVLLNGDASQSVAYQLDFSTSSWWSITVGLNMIRLNAATYSSNAQLQVLWRDNYI